MFVLFIYSVKPYYSSPFFCFFLKSLNKKMIITMTNKITIPQLLFIALTYSHAIMIDGGKIPMPVVHVNCQTFIFVSPAP